MTHKIPRRLQRWMRKAGVDYQLEVCNDPLWTNKWVVRTKNKVRLTVEHPDLISALKIARSEWRAFARIAI